jgi:WD40 repeat protein/outer membrane murein-binding lipoprotein Lpp
MHHKRVVQEKNKVITDLKRLKAHYAEYEPTLALMRKKYEAATKEKTMVKLERDRLRAKVSVLEAQVAQLENIRPQTDVEPAARPARARPTGAVLPKSARPNPFIGTHDEPQQVDAFSLQATQQAHDVGIAAIAHHPTKPIVATASDDSSWRMWTVPNGELVMSGEGHTDWLSSIEFHPHGSHLATGSGDATVKVWDFRTASCAATFSDHTQAVWDVAWHDLGDFLVSASMDHTAKLWDVVSGRCRSTFRGHVDSINACVFQPFSENLCTGSGDKTVSLWDCRTALCIQTFYGHMNAVSSVAFSARGDRVASTDADGVVKLWDVRKVSEFCQIYAGPHPANHCAFDRSGSVLAVASDDGSVKVFNVDTAASDSLEQRAAAHLNDLRGHEEPVQCVAFEPNGNKYLVSSSSDASYRLWS